MTKDTTYHNDPDWLDAEEDDRLAALEAADAPTDWSWVLYNHRRKVEIQRAAQEAPLPVPSVADGFEDKIPF